MKKNSAKKKLGEVIADRDFLFRLIVFLLSSMVFSVLPYVIFVIYMKQNNFFSYDFFNYGLFGMGIFYAFLIILLLTFGAILYIWAFYIPNFVYSLIKKDNVLESLVFMLISFFIFVFISCYILLKGSNASKEYLKFLAFIFIPFFFHYGVLLNCGCKKIYSVVSFVLFVAFAFYGLIEYRVQLIGSLEIVLKNFNVGGRKLVVVRNNDRVMASGKLIFLSPERIYIRQKDELIILTNFDEINVHELNQTK